MTEFKFVDQPPVTNAGAGRNVVYAEFRDALRSRPGEWAVYPREFVGPNARQLAYQCAAHIKYRGNSWVGFDAVARQVAVYVRFVGKSVDA